MPWNFVSAWQQAITILNWQENLPEEDMPPKSIWRDGDKLDAHCKRVKKKWKGGSEDENVPMGSFEDFNSGKKVQLKNRIGDYVRESLHTPHDDFRDF